MVLGFKEFYASNRKLYDVFQKPGNNPSKRQANPDYIFDYINCVVRRIFESFLTVIVTKKATCENARTQVVLDFEGF